MEKEPYLDVYLTISMHSPFDISRNFTIQNTIERFSPLTPKVKKWMEKKPKLINSIAYDDAVLEYFFDEYKKRNDFKNTIFVITGDHDMQNLPLKNELARFSRSSSKFTTLFLKTFKTMKGETLRPLY